MATRRPIVATRVAGCLDAVGPEEAELVPADDPEQMAVAIIRLLDDRELARRRGDAAFTRYEKSFTLGVMVERMRHVYEEVLG
jgi:phosphatidylinositol alpha-1,6-mannosyltransferase